MASAALILLIALIGGWLSRMCGGAPPKLPWGLDQWIYAIPYMIVSIPVLLFFILKKNISKEKQNSLLLLSGVPYMGAFLGKRTGHGGGMDLGTSTKVRKDEALEFLIKPLHGKMSEYNYDLLLLTITGIAPVLLTGILFLFFDPFSGALILISGALKAEAYMIGWVIYPKGSGRGIPHLNEATAIGEFLTGFFAYAALTFAGLRVFGVIA